MKHRNIKATNIGYVHKVKKMQIVIRLSVLSNTYNNVLCQEKGQIESVKKWINYIM